MSHILSCLPFQQHADLLYIHAIVFFRFPFLNRIRMVREIRSMSLDDRDTPP